MLFCVSYRVDHMSQSSDSTQSDHGNWKRHRIVEDSAEEMDQLPVDLWKVVDEVGEGTANPPATVVEPSPPGLCPSSSAPSPSGLQHPPRKGRQRVPFVLESIPHDDSLLVTRVGAGFMIGNHPGYMPPPPHRQRTVERKGRETTKRKREERE
jgi:hypothetical protein